ncbi:hypothetical protein BJX61DRAFT_546073 [Aspergillus egyptiacus]|nr:hypothetical protein BJX61DRAFT_546073 [Aspergillus egyptiacus]
MGQLLWAETPQIQKQKQNHTRKLPIELLQAILEFLDIESFYSASLTCPAWRTAALNHVCSLRRQLRSIPVQLKFNIDGGDASHSPKTQEDDDENLQSLFLRQCRTHLIDLRRRNIQFQSMPNEFFHIQDGKDILIPSPQGSPHVAQLRGMSLILKSRHAVIQLHPSLYPSPRAVRAAMGYDRSSGVRLARAFARLQLAVSGCGELLAVALGPKVHIYHIRSGPRQKHVEVEIGNGTGNGNSMVEAIQGVEFALDDGLLRLEVDGPDGSYVLYLGGGEAGWDASAEDDIGGRKLEYFRRTLKHVYLDSREIERGLLSPGGFRASLRGTRLVGGSRATSHPRGTGEEKYFFGLLHHSPGENTYVVGCVPADGTVRILQGVPTRPAQKSLSPKGSGSGSRSEKIGDLQSPLPEDRWDIANLPVAETCSPFLAVSDDASILAIFEPPGLDSPGAIYLCSACTGLSRGEEPYMAWPFLLSVVHHPLELDSLAVLSDGRGSGGYIVRAQAQQRTMEWMLGRVWSGSFIK